MLLVPYIRFTLLSAKTPEEARAALEAKVAPPRQGGPDPAGRPFVGTVAKDRFKLASARLYPEGSRVPRRPVVSSAVVEGALARHPRGTRIAVVLRQRWATLAVIAVWCAVTAGMAIASLPSEEPVALIPALVLLVVYAALLRGFSREVGRVKALLGEILAAKPL
ncbi:MAG: hypothetical protein H6923_03120 [Alphaproteobacteria bacterium]|nr:hypothetical protein [Alphaproteobacteria bacterium]